MAYEVPTMGAKSSLLGKHRSAPSHSPRRCPNSEQEKYEKNSINLTSNGDTGFHGGANGVRPDSSLSSSQPYVLAEASRQIDGSGDGRRGGWHRRSEVRETGCRNKKRLMSRPWRV